MTNVHYVVLEHDGGWAYKVGDVFSDTYQTHDDAKEAAEIAAREQQRSGEDETIEYQDADGRWTVEESKGQDRPTTDIEG